MFSNLPPRKQASKVAVKAAVHSELPMQARYQDLVNDLNESLKRSPFNQDLFRKYGIKKYSLTNKEKEPVQAFVYDQASKAYPLLEDQAEKRITSLIEAAQHLFEKEGIEADNEIQGIASYAQKRLDELLRQPLDNNEDYEAQVKEVTGLIHQVVHNLAYHWGQAQKNPSGLPKEAYETFLKNLRHAVEEVMPAYKQDQFLTINRDPAVNRVQYAERGTQDGQGGKVNQSSHNRGKVGIANFAVTIAGHVDPDGNLKLTTPGTFRHASFPAIDLYKIKVPNGQPNNYYMPDSVNIATANMLLLEQEMRARLEPKADRKNPSTLTWINVGLLTAQNDKEKQSQIMNETILAADRLRSRGGHFSPITFDFGVNFAAIRLGYYPASQNFENHRAFFKLQEKTLASLNNALPLSEEEAKNPKTPTQKLLAAYSDLGKLLDNLSYQSIEDQINKIAKLLDQALINFQAEESPQNRAEVLKLTADLEEKKVLLHGAANEIMATYTTRYQELAGVINENAELLAKEHQALKIKEAEGKLSGSDLEKLNAANIANYAVLTDFASVINMYTNQTFRQDANNFKLQAIISDMSTQLAVIDNFNPAPDGSRVLTAGTANCKSGNDRTAVDEINIDLISMARSSITPINASRHAISCVTNQITGQDTDGGANKYGGHNTDPTGHPNREFSSHQAKTAKWASKQLFKKILEDVKSESVYAPEKMLIDPFSHQLGQEKVKIVAQLDKLIAKVDKENLNKKPDASKISAYTQKIDLLTTAVTAINQYQQDHAFLNLQQAVTDLKPRESQRERTGRFSSSGAEVAVNKSSFFGSIAKAVDNAIGKHPVTDLINNLSMLVTERAIALQAKAHSPEASQARRYSHSDSDSWEKVSISNNSSAEEEQNHKDTPPTHSKNSPTSHHQ